MRIFVLFLCLFSLPALAAEAISGDSFQQDDGTVVRLLGIKAPHDHTKEGLQKLLDGANLILDNKSTDRYGRILADVYASKNPTQKIWLQDELLKQGLAFVYPPTGGEPHLDELMQAERTARHNKLGLWNETSYADLPANNPAKIRYGRYVFVAGKVVKAERVKNMVYLNFGDDWRTDFTIAIAAHDLKIFRQANIDPLDYHDKVIRVRGWVKRDFGPMITVTAPAQIELLGERPTRP